MDNQEKSDIMQWHYNQLGQDAPFILRASGNFDYADGYSCPTADELSEWNSEYILFKNYAEWESAIKAEYIKAGLTFDYWNEINIEADQTKIDKYISDRNQIRLNNPKPE